MPQNSEKKLETCKDIYLVTVIFPGRQIYKFNTSVSVQLLTFSSFCDVCLPFLNNMITSFKILLLLILDFPYVFARPQQFTFQDSNNPVDSSASDSDPLRQRFSVKAHSRLPYLIISDGYMVTTLRFLDNQSPTALMRSLLIDSTQRLEKACQSMMLSEVQCLLVSFQS